MNMKTCTKCIKEKPLEAYYKASNSSDGKYSICIECKDAATKKWREENTEYYNKTMRDYRAAQDPNDRRDIDLKSWYGLPYGWYKSTLEAQGNVCAICKKPNRSKKRCLAVDHHHDTGKVRGIVCYSCNRALHAFDNVDLFNAIMTYLEKYKEA